MYKTLLPPVSILIIIAVLTFGNSRNISSGIDEELQAVLQEQGFTGDIQKQLKIKLGRNLDKKKVDLGRLIFFDNGLGLHQDNSCAGCHAPGFGFGDSQPIAIGVDNNNIVGANRSGPRNQRRSPSVINTAFYPNLMWNSRFSSLTNDPFDNSLGFEFPPPEGDSLFTSLYGYVNNVKHLLVAQGHLPFTELPEMTGFTNTANLSITFSRFSGLTSSERLGSGERGVLQPLIFEPNSISGNPLNILCADPDFSPFDDGHGFPVPPLDPYYGSPNYAIRSSVLDLINNNGTYVDLFEEIYPEVADSPVNFLMVGEVLAEFEFSLTFAKAPIDKFAMGDVNAMTIAEKRGALIFFGKGNCASCHAVSGISNQMFSDFEVHNVGTPQIYPAFGLGTGNVPFSELDCVNKTPTGRLDYGREEFTGETTDRYKFRSSPLRNAKLQSSFFHNGSFNQLKEAIKFHLDPINNIADYLPENNGVPSDLYYNPSDMPDVMATVDPALTEGVELTNAELEDLYVFVRDGLYDNKAAPEKLKKLIPESVPSGVPVAIFEDTDDSNNAIAKSGIGEKVSFKNDLLKADVMSNPTNSQFSVVVHGREDNVIKLFVRDFNGRLMESKNDLQTGEVILFGQNYHGGVFFAEFIQGENTLTIKLVKL